LKLTEALAAGASYRDAAMQAGCSERTARRRMADPDFRSEVRSVRSTILDRTVGVLAEGAVEAAAKLRELLDAPSSSTRLGAARALHGTVRSDNLAPAATARLKVDLPPGAIPGIAPSTPTRPRT
jgi:hypothetical protein